MLFEKTIKKIILKDNVPHSVAYSKKEKELNCLFNVIRLFWIPAEILLFLAVIAILLSLN